MKIKLLARQPSDLPIVQIEPDQDLMADQVSLQAILSNAKVVQLRLPKFTDGRAYSQAVVLRNRFAYQGHLRVVGDVLADQVQALLRVGFDQIELRTDQIPEVVDGVLGIVSRFYQQPVEPSSATQAQIWLAREEAAYA
jgi:uncharacterized protein (DUF934 family)